MGGKAITRRAIRAVRLARRIECVFAAEPKGHAFHGNQYGSVANPPGVPTGKIRHAVLVIGGKRYKGPSHFQALMGWAAEHPNGANMPQVPESHQGFETESGHFLDRTDAADYALGKGLVKQVASDEKLRSEDMALTARDGQLYTQDAVMATPADPLRSKTEQTYRDAVHRAVLAAEALVLQHKKEGRKKKEAALLLLLLLWLRNAAETAYAYAGPVLEDRARGADVFAPSVPKTELEAFAAEREKLLNAFPQRILDRLDTVAQDSRTLGESSAVLAKRLQATSYDIETGEGARVAATEAQAVLGHAQLRALVNAGYTQKKWVTEGDERVRESHNRCGEQPPIGITERFSNGLRYPGDPDGGPEEVCNCRCWLEGVK